MRIAEIFRSMQGEGRLTGARSVFVRVSGCPLRCRWCDTPYASWTPEGEELSAGAILGRVDALRAESALPGGATCRHVVLTGGEPMLYADLVSLAAGLRQRGMHITVETSATIYMPVECDLMSLSPKLSNSTPDEAVDPAWRRRHEARRDAPEVVRQLVAEYDHQLKFVVDSPDDCAEVERYLARFPEIDRDRVMLMPQGVEAADLAAKAAWLEPYCRRRGLAFCPRRQVEWFGSRRGA
jgi:7-carboxy-7-deazaguanine synthase